MISRLPSWQKWGSSIIPWYMFTCVRYFRVQFFSDDPQAPQNPTHGFFSIILQFITNFHSSPFSTIPKTPRFNPARIIKGVFAILTHLHCFTWNSSRPQDPKIQLRWSRRIFSPFWHFFTNFQWSSRLIIPKAPSPNQRWGHKDPFRHFDIFWSFFGLDFI